MVLRGNVMKINEAEQEVGITRKNIRFYEQQGLLKPMRNLSNGYRDYSDEDIRILRQIKLLRRLGIPIEEIKRLQARLLTLEDCLQRHLITLERERKNLDATASFCERLLSEKASLETIDAGQLLTDIDNMEEGGTRFVNVQKRDQKALRRNSLLSAIVFISFMLAFIAFMIWCSVMDSDMPGLVLVFFIGIPLLFIGGTLLALRERLKEIEGGELDEASKY